MRDLSDGMLLVAGLLIGALLTLVIALAVVVGRRRRPDRHTYVDDAPVPSHPEVKRSALLAATLVLFEVIPVRGRPRPPHPARALPRQRPRRSPSASQRQSRF